MGYNMTNFNAISPPAVTPVQRIAEDLPMKNPEVMNEANSVPKTEAALDSRYNAQRTPLPKVQENVHNDKILSARNNLIDKNVVLAQIGNTDEVTEKVFLPTRG